MTSSSILGEWPVGLRFLPTDEELINHYLKHKMHGNESEVRAIREVDVCKFEPWDLPDLSEMKSKDHQWFFFSLREFKYSNSNRSNRTTRAGFWKATGKDRTIKSRGTNKVIGTKKTLVFYRGRVPKGIKTNWVIHEYHQANIHPHQRAFVICRLMEKAEISTEKRTDMLTYGDGEPSSWAASDYENQAIEDTIPEVYDMLETNPGSHFPVDNDLFSIMQSPVNIELPPFTDVPDECNSSQFLNNAYEQELDLNDEFLNSILVEQDDYTTAETVYCLVNDSPTLESQRKLYHDDGGLSSDADTESIVALRAYMEGEYVGSTEYRQMKMVAGSDSAARADTQISFRRISGREKKESIFYNNSLGFDTSSGESAEDRHFEINLLAIASEDSTVSVPTADTHFEINSIQIDSEESPVSVPTANTHFGINCIQVADVESPITVRSRSKGQSRPIPTSFPSKRPVTRSRTQMQKRVLRSAESHDEAKEEISIVKSNTDRRKVQGISPRKYSKPTNIPSSGINWKSFISLETPPLKQNSSPQLVYLVNVVIGLCLFVAVIFEMIA